MNVKEVEDNLVRHNIYGAYLVCTICGVLIRRDAEYILIFNDEVVCPVCLQKSGQDKGEAE